MTSAKLPAPDRPVEAARGIIKPAEAFDRPKPTHFPLFAGRHGPVSGPERRQFLISW
ncbi:hypothetical protein SBA3_2210008 [Candidatus Sulfopaludibacter sp. SbA3]|nr:hypothetical protein SBA3_2210008 [Candidatus Sulfopaludibacter sp. SbA3]